MKELNNPLPYILAGKAIFTILNTETQNRYTYKVTISTRDKTMFIVNVFNEHQYKYIGIIKIENNTKKFIYSKKSELNYDSTEVKGFYFIFGKILINALPNVYKVYHSGKCGRCGRTLTTPESIATGFGSECIKHVI